MSGAAAAASQTIPKFLPSFAHKYVGNPTLFQFLKKYEAQYPFIQSINSVYNVAPASKWGLSIVPLYGVFTGYPAVEKIDENTTFSLACTGFVWTIYAMIISPQNAGSRALATVNACMFCVNGYNFSRKQAYLKSKAGQ